MFNTTLFILNLAVLILFFKEILNISIMQFILVCALINAIGIAYNIVKSIKKE